MQRAVGFMASIHIRYLQTAKPGTLALPATLAPLSELVSQALYDLGLASLPASQNLTCAFGIIRMQLDQSCLTKPCAHGGQLKWSRSRSGSRAIRHLGTLRHVLEPAGLPLRHCSVEAGNLTGFKPHRRISANTSFQSCQQSRLNKSRYPQQSYLSHASLPEASAIFGGKRIPRAAPRQMSLRSASRLASHNEPRGHAMARCKLKSLGETCAQASQEYKPATSGSASWGCKQ